MPLPKVLALIMIISTMLGAGLQLDRAHLAKTLHQYGLLGRAFLANFVLVPLCAVLLVRLFHVNTEISIGIVLMAIAPGVPFLANSAGRAGGGSLSFAITIAFLFAALSVITIPITIALVLPPAAAAHIPLVRFLGTMVAFQLLPLVLGALISPRLPTPMLDKVVRVLHLAFLVAALILVVLIFPRIVSSIATVFGFGHMLIIAAIGIFSIAMGWLLGGPNPQYRRTLSIATLMKNIGLCALIGTTSTFARTAVVPTIFVYFIVTFVLSLIPRIYFKRTKDLVAGAHSR